MWNPEVIIYRMFRGMVLVTTILLFRYYFDRFCPLQIIDPVVLLTVGLQMLLLIRPPANDTAPLKCRHTDRALFYKDELRFIFLVIALDFLIDLNFGHAALGAALAINFVFQTILFIIWRQYYLSTRLPQNERAPSDTEKNVIIVGASNHGKRVADLFLKHPELDIRVLGFVDHRRESLWRYRDIPLLGRPDEVKSIVSRRRVDFVIMATERDDLSYSQEIFDTLEKMGVKICLLPEIFDRTISHGCISSLNGQPVFLYHSLPEAQFALLCKAIADRALAALGLILSVPVLAAAAVAIKIDSRGPIFYRQKRMGRNGRLFDMLKLRTMTDGAERLKTNLKNFNEMSGPVFKIKDDPRVTRVGKLLRRFSLDELPQFVNVLKGDMSLVGPRPPLPKEVEQYAPWQHRRLSVKPGVTCLWQVNGRNRIDFDDWMKLDLQYIDQWSFKEDVKILARTLPAVIKGDGAS